jgi:hypothetical protein
LVIYDDGLAFGFEDGRELGSFLALDDGLALGSDDRWTSTWF